MPAFDTEDIKGIHADGSRYGVHVEKPGFFADSIIKVDAQTRKTAVWTPRVNGLPSEPVFVARPGGTCEDDGVLLLVLMDTSREQSALVVLDAQSMTEVGRAE
jgi:torulene dioxygenase